MDKITPENVKPKDWITVGVRDSVVCRVYEDEPNKVEVVYLDRNRPINEDAHYIDNGWTFVYDGPCGGYADQYPRLADFVAILKAGRWR